MKAYKLVVSTAALSDIQEVTNWYNQCLPKLGTRFQQAVKKQISTLKYNANSCAIRYQNVRCLLVKKFPYLIHFTINEVEEIVEVFAIIHTSRTPDIWEERNKLI